MNLFIFNSSIGRKLIMSLSGLFLMLFLLIHLTVNSLLLVGPEAFQAGCEFMELPVVTIMVPILAAGFIVHIIYAAWLTWQNRKARGSVAYASGKKSETTSWASKNMFVLGLVVLGVIAIHLSHFWAKMQLPHFMGTEGVPASQAYDLVANIFRNPCWAVIYIIWYGALWFHLTHGFWSALQTIGFNNTTWYYRLRWIGIIFATIVAFGFTGITLFFALGVDKLVH
ncbi:MAG: succinate dehydrogenase cytochrome b subunit [Prevotellaceae bacterium]|jgi:succinate dehydrogenase / fumarate reductase cytochrome b subunit|nr:succinate dehydrogenase cytochrome b subunit [Prevotellaceae bacterium]